MDRVLDRLIGWMQWPNAVMVRVAGVGLFAVMAALVANVVMRQFGRPLNGTVELVAMIAAVTFALSMGEAQDAKTHVSIDLLERRWPKRARLAVGAILTVASLALFAQLITSLIVYGDTMRGQGSSTEALRIPFWPSVFLVVIGFCGLSLALATDLVRTLRAWRSDDPAASIF